MLTIKLARRGKRNQPFYRLVLLEKSKNPWSEFLEDLGHYDPRSKNVSLKVERIKYWLSCGAQPSGSVHNLLVNQGVIIAKKVKVTKGHKNKTEDQTQPTQPEKK